MSLGTSFFPRPRKIDTSQHLSELREDKIEARLRRELESEREALRDRADALAERERRVRAAERRVEQELPAGEGCVGQSFLLSEAPGRTRPGGLTAVAKFILDSHALAMGKTSAAEPPTDNAAKMIVAAANGTLREERPKPLSKAAELIVRANSLRYGEEPLSNDR
jgi:hypothetical protein